MNRRTFLAGSAACAAAGATVVPSTLLTGCAAVPVNPKAKKIDAILAEGARVMWIAAHPDDENNGLLVKLNRGLGLRTALLTVTRGDGGQNEIGPELFQAIGILRSEELVEMHPRDAVALKVASGDMVRVTSRRGEVTARALVTEASPPGTISMTFHFHEAPTNVLTNAAWDPVAKIPETKVCAVRIEKP